MALDCSQYNAYSDRLILGHYSSVMPTGPDCMAAKTKQKVIINYCFFLKIVAALNDAKRRSHTTNILQPYNKLLMNLER